MYGACSGDELTIRRLNQYTVFMRAGNRLLLAYGERDSDEDGAEPMDSEATISEEGGRADQRSGQGTKREAPAPLDVHCGLPCPLPWQSSHTWTPGLPAMPGGVGQSL